MSRLALIIFVSLAGPAQAQDFAATTLEAADRASFSYRLEAMRKIKRLLKKRVKPSLLVKLAELQLDQSDSAFRIAHASAYRKQKRIGLKRHRKYLEQSIVTLSRLIRNFPDHADIPWAYLMRAKAYDEAGQRSRSEKDYLHLVAQYPKYPGLDAAFVSLAEYAEARNNYVLQLRYLRELESRRKDEEYYRFALFKTAWANYHLLRMKQAFRYVRRYTDYLNESLKSDKFGPKYRSRLISLRNDLLIDTAQFYFRGVAQNQYDNDDALDFFAELMKGPNTQATFKKILVKYTKYLRTDNREAALIGWKKQLVQGRSSDPTTLKIVLMIYDDQLNKGRYEWLQHTSQDIIALYEKHGDDYSFKRARTALLQVSPKIRTAIRTEKSRLMKKKLYLVKANVLANFLQISTSSEPRVYRTKFNIAESLVAAGEREKALIHYDWILDNHGGAPLSGKYKINVVSTGLKGVSIRYDKIEKEHLSKEIKPVSRSEDESDELDDELEKWISHIAKVESLNTARRTSRAKTQATKDIEFYSFEAGRLLYSQERIERALAHLRKFIQRHPRSRHAISASNLILDTYIASDNWVDTHDVARELIAIRAFRGTHHMKHLRQTAVDAFYKVNESHFDGERYKQVIANHRFFKAQYWNSNRRSEWLNLAANSAIKTQNTPLAIFFYGHLVDQDHGSTLAPHAILYRASTFEKQYEFDRALLSYRNFLKHPGMTTQKKLKKVPNLREKMLLLAWMSSTPSRLPNTLKNSKICTPQIEEVCDRYRALYMLRTPGAKRTKSDFALAKQRRRNGFVDNRSLWALYLLDAKNEMPFWIRMKNLRIVSQNWDDVDPMVEYSLLPVLKSVLPTNFRLVRSEIRKEFKLRPTEKSLATRLEWIEHAEKTASQISEMPWNGIKTSILTEVSGLYHDMANDVLELKAPKGLDPEEQKAILTTFREIAQPIQESAGRIAKRAAELQKKSTITGRFFEENNITSISFELLNKLDPKGQWDDLEEAQPDQPRLYIKRRWAQAVRLKNWPEVAFLLQTFKEEELVKPEILKTIWAVSLAAIGATAEALGQLKLALMKTGKTEDVAWLPFLLPFSGGVQQ